MSSAKPRLAVSMGDPAGIGPEIIAAAATRAAVRRACDVVVYGDVGVMAAASALCGQRARAGGRRSAVERVESVTQLRFSGPTPRPGRTAGHAAFLYLDAAARAAWSGECDALVTAPINKYWLHRAGHEYDGHTGYLSELTGCSATMMLAGPRLRVVLATTHIALADVPRVLSTAGIRDATLATRQHLRRYYGLPSPHLAVAALNPHGGEAGLFGDEEKRVIAPAVRALRRARVRVDGPLPADTLFAAAANGAYDAVVCMYHDQALIPLKLLDFGRAVNVSMGLPFVRTSPDHGTAYDVAGSGRARADSMVEALLAAASMVTNRQGRR